MFISCGNEGKVFFDIKEDEVDKIVLHWEEHHYHNQIADNILLDGSKVAAFVQEFNDVKSVEDDLDLEHNCFQLHIYYWDGLVDKYKFDGHFIKNMQNHNYYVLSDEDNLITKYWGLNERDFCVKVD